VPILLPFPNWNGSQSAIAFNRLTVDSVAAPVSAESHRATLSHRQLALSGHAEFRC